MFVSSPLSFNRFATSIYTFNPARDFFCNFFKKINITYIIIKNLKMKKYAIYNVDPNNIDITNIDYEEIRGKAMDFETSDDLGELLSYLVRNLNDDRLSDTNLFFVTDEDNGTILFS